MDDASPWKPSFEVSVNSTNVYNCRVSITVYGPRAFALQVRTFLRLYKMNLSGGVHIEGDLNYQSPPSQLVPLCLNLCLF